RSARRRARHRPRYRRRVPAARLRALPPGRGRPTPEGWRPRSRPYDREKSRRPAWRLADRRERRGRQGRDVHRRAARAHRVDVRRRRAARRAGSDDVVTQDGRSILVVEDDEGLRSAIAAFLEGEGYSVIEAEDGEAALRVLDSTERFCLILLD